MGGISRETRAVPLIKILTRHIFEVILYQVLQSTHRRIFQKSKIIVREVKRNHPFLFAIPYSLSLIVVSSSFSKGISVSSQVKYPLTECGSWM